jgi:hypothetical protein
MTTVTESIFAGKQAIVPLADVQHIEPWANHTVPGIRVITKHTRWDRDAGDWGNSIWISEPEAAEFRRAWCRYRSELEAGTLAEMHGPAKRAAEFKKQPLGGAMVATIHETPDGMVEVVARKDGRYGLVVHARRGESDRWDDLSAYLTADEFDALGSVAGHIRAAS